MCRYVMVFSGDVMSFRSSFAGREETTKDVVPSVMKELLRYCIN